MSIPLDGQHLAFVSPFEGFSHGAIEVVNEFEQTTSKVGLTAEAGSFQQLSDQDAEPDFDLIQPRSMGGCVMKHDLMVRVAEKRGPCFHGLQYTAFTFHPQIEGQAFVLGHQLD